MQLELNKMIESGTIEVKKKERVQMICVWSVQNMKMFVLREIFLEQINKGELIFH